MARITPSKHPTETEQETDDSGQEELNRAPEEGTGVSLNPDREQLRRLGKIGEGFMGAALKDLEQRAKDPEFQRKLKALIQDSVGQLKLPHVFACEGSRERVQSVLEDQRIALAQTFADNPLIDVVLNAYTAALGQLSQMTPEPHEALNVFINVGPETLMTQWTKKPRRLPKDFASVVDLERYEEAQARGTSQGLI